MTKKRMKKAIDVIKYAIENNISVKAASAQCGYNYTYVKNVKATINEKYKKGTLSEEEYSLFYDAYNRYLTAKEKSTKESVNKEIQEEKIKVISRKKQNKVNFSVKENNNEANLEWSDNSMYSSDHIKTLDQLLEKCEVDRDIWYVKDYVVNKWDTPLKIKDEPTIVENFNVKARLERNVEVVKTKNTAEIFVEMTKNYKAPILNVKKITRNGIDENNMLEISIFDLHLGKLAWAGETFENYDVKIASKRFLTSIEKLLQRASGFSYSKILFPIGNDFFNSDNMQNTTTKGTQQDEDLRWQKTFKVGTQLLVDAINTLKQTGVPVDVIIIPGNHDFERSYYMGSFLEAWFNKDPMVNINNGASPRKYYKFGNLLLGFTHGNEEKEASLPLLMANDAESKPLWSETLFHEWHLGHIHRKRNMKYTVLDKSRMLNEDLGVTVRYLSSLTGTEEWHHKKGFIGSTKAADGFIWNDEFGLVAHLNTNLIIK